MTETPPSPPSTCHLCRDQDGIWVAVRHLGRIAPPLRTWLCSACLSRTPGNISITVLNECSAGTAVNADAAQDVLGALGELVDGCADADAFEDRPSVVDDVLEALRVLGDREEA